MVARGCGPRAINCPGLRLCGLFLELSKATLLTHEIRPSSVSPSSYHTTASECETMETSWNGLVVRSTRNRHLFEAENSLQVLPAIDTVVVLLIASSRTCRIHCWGHDTEEWGVSLRQGRGGENMKGHQWEKSLDSASVGRGPLVFPLRKGNSVASWACLSPVRDGREKSGNWQGAVCRSSWDSPCCSGGPPVPGRFEVHNREVRCPSRRSRYPSCTLPTTDAVLSPVKKTTGCPKAIIQISSEFTIKNSSSMRPLQN